MSDIVQPPSALFRAPYTTTTSDRSAKNLARSTTSSPHSNTDPNSQTSVEMGEPNQIELLQKQINDMIALMQQRDNAHAAELTVTVERARNEALAEVVHHIPEAPIARECPLR